jgi:phosphocarrier protein HPr
MLSKKIIIQNKLGLHARAAAKLVNTASKFSAEINITCHGKNANGKSVIDLMLLAAKQNNEIELTASGEEATQATTAIEQLINEKFGETE